MTMVSRLVMRACGASSRRFGSSRPSRPGRSSRRPEPRKPKSIMGTDRGSVTPLPVSTGGRALGPDAGLLAQIGAAAGATVERSGLGRTARAGVPAAGWQCPRRRARQPQGRRPHAGHVRPDAQSALWRRPRPLRNSRPAVSRSRPGSQGKVAAGVGHAKKTPLRNRRFERLDDAQGHLDRWEQRWVDTRFYGCHRSPNSPHLWSLKTPHRDY